MAPNHDIATQALVVALKSPSVGKTTQQVVEVQQSLTQKARLDRYGREKTCAVLAGELSQEVIRLEGGNEYKEGGDYTQRRHLLFPTGTKIGATEVSQSAKPNCGAAHKTQSQQAQSSAPSVLTAFCRGNLQRTLKPSLVNTMHELYRSFRYSLLFTVAVFHVGQAANFKTCIEYLNGRKNDCSGPDLICPQDKSANIKFTYPGCLSHCGSGFELDGIDDIIGRFFLWLVPALILGAHFHFPPLSTRNTLAVCAMLLGNPIGSLSSMLTRLEKFHHGYRQAREHGIAGPEDGDSEDVAADVAAVCVACDELGFNNPLSTILGHITNRSIGGTETLVGSREGNFTPNTAVCIQDTGASTAASEALEPRLKNQEGPIGQRMESIEESAAPRNEMENGNAEWRTSNSTPGNKGLDLDEVLFFAEARHDLISHRRESQIGTTFAIIGLICALAGAFVRVWQNRGNPWSSRTIPMVIMTFHFIAMIQTSAVIGSFTSPFGPLLVLQLLQRRIRDRDLQVGRPSRQSLLFPIDLDPDTIWKGRANLPDSRSNCIPDVELQEWLPAPNLGETNKPLIDKTCENGSELPSCLELPKEWPKTARYLGLNSTFRPLERLNASENKHKSSWREFLYAFGFVTLAWFTAFAHSYFAVGHFGFGCRSLIWTLIYLSWILSFSASYALQSPLVEKWLGISSYESLWRCTVAKDTFVSALIVGAITVTHIGLTSTCFCKSGDIRPPVWQHPIDLLPLTGKQEKLRWVQITVSAIGGLIFISVPKKTRAKEYAFATGSS
ncbi:uncharacterized protein BDR25DRAFT_392096 [Lindgomyces ingoldianus]|uniref:Uncharacterized protein n=1 Tax=Lindgomyces ingoldianus TaxID=673940 RepID=A0ACB6R6G6_9PLEO|nr:uncharacterized protein BDR25DRAFT_392096 [Lindgomyces ingoldianus]KAF2474428.1 hypothetical protein BDR25DRAFT_392096 [Lindgomyces ingoldianus]